MIKKLDYLEVYNYFLPLPWIPSVVEILSSSYGAVLDCYEILRQN